MAKRKKKKLPDPIEADFKRSTYQPSKAEQMEEQDMPELTVEQVRSMFMRPFKPKKASD